MYLSCSNSCGKRTKLYDKSLCSVLLGVSKVSKEHMFYDSISQKIITSMNVVFEEYKGWNWIKKYEWVISCDLEAIKRSSTCELMELPKGAKEFWVKSVYKTKFKGNGEMVCTWVWGKLHISICTCSSHGNKSLDGSIYR